MKELVEHLSDCVFQEFLDSESPLRDSALATLLSSETSKKKESPNKKKEETPEKPKKEETPGKPKKRGAEAAGKTETPAKQSKTGDPSKKQELLDILAEVKQNAGKSLDLIPDDVSSDGEGKAGSGEED